GRAGSARDRPIFNFDDSGLALDQDHRRKPDAVEKGPRRADAGRLTVWNRAPRVPLGGENDVPASPAGLGGLRDCRRRAADREATREAAMAARAVGGTRSLPQFAALNYSGNRAR